MAARTRRKTWHAPSWCWFDALVAFDPIRASFGENTGWFWATNATRTAPRSAAGVTIDHYQASRTTALWVRATREVCD
jgi:hypothetical protein